MQTNVHSQMAKYAYEEVSKHSTDGRELRSLARSFPSMLQVNGLGASVAFLKSKESSPAYRDMYQFLNNWTKSKFGEEEEDLMKRITSMNSTSYRIYTNEIMSLCIWIKRFAEGMIKKDD